MRKIQPGGQQGVQLGVKHFAPGIGHFTLRKHGSPLFFPMRHRTSGPQTGPGNFAANPPAKTIVTESDAVPGTVPNALSGAMPDAAPNIVPAELPHAPPINVQGTLSQVSSRSVPTPRSSVSRKSPQEKTSAESRSDNSDRLSPQYNSSCAGAQDRMLSAREISHTTR